MCSNVCVCVCVQVSALDQELIEVDPDTKEMLKLLVSLFIVLVLTVNTALVPTEVLDWSICNILKASSELIG